MVARTNAAARVPKMIASSTVGMRVAEITLADISTAYWRLLERPPEGVDVERVRIRGRWSCDPPPGVTVSTPMRPMAAWILRPEVVPPKRCKGLDR